MSTAALGTLESGIEIAIPTSEPGIGKVILSPDEQRPDRGCSGEPFRLVAR